MSLRAHNGRQSVDLTLCKNALTKVWDFAVIGPRALVRLRRRALISMTSCVVNGYQLWIMDAAAAQIKVVATVVT